MRDMQEEIGQPVTFIGRWRGRRLWILLCASLLAAAVVFLLVWINPSSDTGEPALASLDQEATQPASEAEAGAGGAQPQQPTDQPGGQAPSVTPGTGEDATGMVINFPDPEGSAPETPPPEGYTDVYGRWVLDMDGTQYGLSNCHIVLNQDGTISSPPDYSQVFEIASSSFVWQAGEPAFTASLQLMLKMSSGQMLIPVRIELRGTAADSLQEIAGDFTAEPQGEVYAPYAQQGGFVMHR